MRKKKVLRKYKKRDTSPTFFILIGNKKPIPIRGRQAAVNKAWEMSERTNAVIRVVRLVAKFRSGAQLGLHSGRAIKAKRRRKA